MRIFIYANDSQEKEFNLKPAPAGVDFRISRYLPVREEMNDHDAFFLLMEENVAIDFKLFNEKPVIINAVSKRLSDLPFSKNVARINAWPGFLERAVWEIAYREKEIFIPLFQKLNWEIIVVKDEPGMIAGRVISMIINEAFYAMKENVSTKIEIDLAMKLGTNYPLGPFDWAEKIGVEKVYDLLTVLANNDQRCIPCFNRDGSFQIC